ncbi:MAG: mycofactocin biosynthesis glycosyltransferase MftF [Actinomycetes bacterium]
MASSGVDAPEVRAGLRPGTRVAWDGRARLWNDGAVVTGGAPWGLVRVSARARPFVRRVHAAGASGVVPDGAIEGATADLLVQRGVVHPAVDLRSLAGEVVVVVPAHDRVGLLEACLRRLAGAPVVVVDDGSRDEVAVRRVAERHGARVVRLDVNQGPGAARNAGVLATAAPLVAFLDSDCSVSPGWLEGLVAHFDDPRVGLVAPRVRPRVTGVSLLARHEDARSALDMGGRPELVRRGAPLGFLPSAALLVRRDALAGQGFEPSMRVGEDVDLVWRLADAGWLARYEPSVVVHHEARLDPVDWARRRFEYGTSAADLDRRHPGRLAPVRVSAWNVAVALLAPTRPRLAALVAATAVGTLGGRLRWADAPPWLAGVVVGQGLVADAAAVGHGLRRVWWPVGWVALAAAGRSRVAAAAAVSMLAPVALEYVRHRPDVDPVRYAALRLAEDAVYGTGVIVSAVRARRPRALLPTVRLPFARPRRR